MILPWSTWLKSLVLKPWKELNSFCTSPKVRKHFHMLIWYLPGVGWNHLALMRSTMCLRMSWIQKSNIHWLEMLLEYITRTWLKALLGSIRLSVRRILAWTWEDFLLDFRKLYKLFRFTTGSFCCITQREWEIHGNRMFVMDSIRRSHSMSDIGLETMLDMINVTINSIRFVEIWTFTREGVEMFPPVCYAWSEENLQVKWRKVHLLNKWCRSTSIVSQLGSILCCDGKYVSSDGRHRNRFPDNVLKKTEVAVNFI